MQKVASHSMGLQPLPQKELKLLPWLVYKLGHFWREDKWIWGLRGALHTVIRENRL